MKWRNPKSDPPPKDQWILLCTDLVSEEIPNIDLEWTGDIIGFGAPQNWRQAYEFGEKCKLIGWMPLSDLPPAPGDEKGGDQ